MLAILYDFSELDSISGRQREFVTHSNISLEASCELFVMNYILELCQCVLCTDNLLQFPRCHSAKNEQ